MKFLAAVFTAAFLASGAHAQDKEKIKNEIMEKLKEYIAEKEKALVDKIAKVLDEEVKKAMEQKGVKPPEEKKNPPKTNTKPWGYMGVQAGQPLTDDELKELGIDAGVRIQSVLEGGPAEKAKILGDDIILTVDGDKIDSVQTLVMTLREKGEGTKVKVEVLRDGEKKTLSVTLEKHPNWKEPDK